MQIGEKVSKSCYEYGSKKIILKHTKSPKLPLHLGLS
jgi:hypothetical protein